MRPFVSPYSSRLCVDGQFPSLHDRNNQVAWWIEAANWIAREGMIYAASGGSRLLERGWGGEVRSNQAVSRCPSKVRDESAGNAISTRCNFAREYLFFIYFNSRYLVLLSVSYWSFLFWFIKMQVMQKNIGACLFLDVYIRFSRTGISCLSCNCAGLIQRPKFPVFLQVLKIYHPWKVAAKNKNQTPKEPGCPL